MTGSKINDILKRKLTRLFNLVLTLNQTKDDDYFMSFAGHCEVVDVYVYRGGWSDFEYPEYIMFCEYLDSEGFEERLDEAIKTLEEEARK
jgi:hypothetical protein